MATDNTNIDTLLSLDPAGIVLRAALTHPNTFHDVADWARRLIHYVDLHERIGGGNANDNNGGNNLNYNNRNSMNYNAGNNLDYNDGSHLDCNNNNNLNYTGEQQQQQQQPVSEEEQHHVQPAGEQQDDQAPDEERTMDTVHSDNSIMLGGSGIGRSLNDGESNVARMPTQASRERISSQQQQQPEPEEDQHHARSVGQQQDDQAHDDQRTMDTVHSGNSTVNGGSGTGRSLSNIARMPPQAARERNGSEQQQPVPEEDQQHLQPVGEQQDDQRTMDTIHSDNSTIMVGGSGTGRSLKDNEIHVGRRPQHASRDRSSSEQQQSWQHALCGGYTGRSLSDIESTVVRMPPQASTDTSREQQQQAPQHAVLPQGDPPRQDQQQSQVPQLRRYVDLDDGRSMPHVGGRNEARLPSQARRSAYHNETFHNQNHHRENQSTKRRRFDEVRSGRDDTMKDPKWCTVEKSLKNSQLRYSVGHTRYVLDFHLSALKLTSSFGEKRVVCKYGSKISQLALEQTYSELPGDEHQTLKVLFRRDKNSQGHSGWGHALCLKPDHQQFSVPIFWAPKHPQANNHVYYHYIGHFQCIRYQDNAQSAYPGGRQGRLSYQSLFEFEFKHFDYHLDEILAHIDPNVVDDGRKHKTLELKRHPAQSRKITNNRPREEATQSVTPRGRGLGTTFPAWMTRNNDNGPAKAPPKASKHLRFD